jgi:hypothetical protein
MDKDLINRYYSKLQQNKFIKSNKFLNNILEKVEKRIPKSLKYNHSKLHINKIDQPELITSDFIDKEYTEYILNKLKYNYSITINYKQLVINFNYYSITDKLTMKYFNDIIEHIILFHSIFGGNINEVNLVIYDTPFKKKIIKNKFVTPKNINSAYSIPFTKQIVIFRKEELKKVLIHELLHIFQFQIRETNESCGMFCDLYSIKTEPFLVNEAIVELYAIIYNSIILVLDLYKKLNKARIIEALNIELEFNLYQTAKVLKHSKFNNLDEFLCKCTSKNILEIKTNLVSYIIIKTLILFNMNELHNFDVMDNRTLIENMVKEFFGNIKYQKIVDYYMNEIHKKGQIDNNLRMSLFS